MELEKDVEGTCFDSVFRTETTRQMLLSQYIVMVRSDVNASLVCLLREAKKAGNKAECEKLKKKLPLFVAGGRMEGGRRLEHLVSYSHCLPIDIDESAIPPGDLLGLACHLPYVKAGNVSPGGGGVKLFVLVDSDLQHHALAFELVRRHIEADLPGVVVDISGKDPNRGCFIGYDPAAFFKEEAEVMQVPVVEPAIPAHEARPVPPADLAKAITAYIEKFEADHSFADGVRHTYLVKLASALNSAGFPHFEVASACVCRYALPDFTTAEIEATVTDVYRRYSSAYASNKANAPKNPKIPTPIPSKAPLPVAEDEEAGIQLDERLLPHFGEQVYTDLPPILADIVAHAHDRSEKDVKLMTALVLLSSMLPHVSGSLMKVEYFTCLYGILIGPSGSGKGCASNMRGLIEPWQQYIYDRSRKEVEKYEEQLREYEGYLQSRKGKGKNAQTSFDTPVEKPRVVKQKNLSLFGYVTLARLLELLQDNSPYASCLYETEIESLIHNFMQDFGGYGYVLNQAAHHESAGSDSKMNGTAVAKRPQLSLFASGTDDMFRRMIPSTENGLFSRMLIYKLVGDSEYRPLSDDDDTPSAARYYDDLGLRLLEIGKHLDGLTTWVRFSDAQRKRLDRFFKREYDNVRVFENEDLASAVLRYRIATFRIAMILTTLRKGESRGTVREMTVSDTDFETAFEVARTCLQHAYVVSTSLKRATKEVAYKFPYNHQKLFADMPDNFKRSELMAEGAVRGFGHTTVDRLLKKCESFKLVVSLGGGYYEKTSEGKEITSPEIP